MYVCISPSLPTSLPAAAVVYGLGYRSSSVYARRAAEPEESVRSRGLVCVSVAAMFSSQPHPRRSIDYHFPSSSSSVITRAHTNTQPPENSSEVLCSFHCVTSSTYFLLSIHPVSIFFLLKQTYTPSFFSFRFNCASVCLRLHMGCVCWDRGVKGSKGYGGGDAPTREAISQLVCSLGSQAENAADLWNKLKWCQCRNKAPS